MKIHLVYHLTADKFSKNKIDREVLISYHPKTLSLLDKKKKVILQTVAPRSQKEGMGRDYYNNIAMNFINSSRA